MKNRRGPHVSLLLAVASFVCLVIFVALTFWLSPPEVLHTAKDTPPISAEGIKVVDGDSLIASGENIRLMCVDAPEKDQPGGRAATALLAQLVSQRINVLRRGKDRYGRTLGILVISRNGMTTTASEELIREGHAWLYRRYSEDCGISRKKLENLENEARSANRGLWRDKEPIPPWEWRSGHK